MKKFKIKNRRKRKYVRKMPNTPYFYLSRTVLVGLVPSLLIAIGLFTTILIKSPPFKATTPDISGPITAFTRSVQSMYDESVRSVSQPAVNMPKVSTPDIDTRSFSNTVSSLLTIIHNNFKILFAFTGNLYMRMLSSLTNLNPLPFLQLFIESVISLSVTSYRLLSNTINNLTTVTMQFFSWFGKSISTLTVTIIQFLKGVLTGIWNIMSVVGAFLTDIAMKILNVLAAFYQSVITFLDHALIRTVNAAKTFLYFITAPFRVVGAYIKSLSPYFAWFGKMISLSARQLDHSMKDTFKAVKTLPPPSDR